MAGESSTASTAQVLEKRKSRWVAFVPVVVLVLDLAAIRIFL
jgi:hypothetical protein